MIADDVITSKERGIKLTKLGVEKRRIFVVVRFCIMYRKRNRKKMLAGRTFHFCLQNSWKSITVREKESSSILKRKMGFFLSAVARRGGGLILLFLASH